MLQLLLPLKQSLNSRRSGGSCKFRVNTGQGYSFILPSSILMHHWTSLLRIGIASIVLMAQNQIGVQWKQHSSPDLKWQLISVLIKRHWLTVCANMSYNSSCVKLFDGDWRGFVIESDKSYMTELTLHDDDIEQSKKKTKTASRHSSVHVELDVHHSASQKNLGPQTSTQPTLVITSGYTES